MQQAAFDRAACRGTSRPFCRRDVMTDRRLIVPDIQRRPAGDDRAWASFRQLTAARIGLQRAGASLATGPLLEFALAHARARDAVNEQLDEARLAAELAGLGAPVLSVSSAAQDRSIYLMRPDLGRRLASDGEAALAAHRADYDIVFVIAGGLSARAVQMHAHPVLANTIAILRAEGWRIAPLVIVRHGRVAIGDAIAAALGAASVAALIGERPGLSAPDSMGAYLTCSLMRERPTRTAIAFPISGPKASTTARPPARSSCTCCARCALDGCRAWRSRITPIDCC